ncbi:hypothetical protein D3C80_622780 [compost metagenome]
MRQDLARHAFWQFDGRVTSKQLDVTDVTAADVTFVSDRANDMTNFNAVITAHFNAVQLHFANVTALATWAICATITAVWTCVTTTVAAAVVTVVEFTTLTWFEHGIRWQDQRTFALCHFQQCCGQGFHFQLFFRLQFSQQCAVHVQIAAFQLLLYFSGELGQTTLTQQFCVWQFNFWNGQLHGAFDVAQQAAFAVFYEQQRTAGTTSTAGTADTVNVRL